MTATVLDKILAAARRRAAAAKDLTPERALEAAPLFHEPRRGFRAALERARPFAVIAELKKASPSKGLLCPDFDPARIARAYEDNGAAALSVLTEPEFFLGGLENLGAARRETGLPLLRKDFIVDPYQLAEARAAGADCVLLIAAALSSKDLESFTRRAHELELDVLVEVHNAGELEQARDCGADIFGVNNRNLKTFEVSIETSLRLAELLPARACRISESGLKTRADLDTLHGAGFTGFLIGETLVASGDPGRALQHLLGGISQ
jgi:indole-3-glycerol phosphate synthase